jgi:hypothetical protein
VQDILTKSRRPPGRLIFQPESFTQLWSLPTVAPTVSYPASQHCPLRLDEYNQAPWTGSGSSLEMEAREGRFHAVTVCPSRSRQRSRRSVRWGRENKSGDSCCARNLHPPLLWGSPGAGAVLGRGEKGGFQGGIGIAPKHPSGTSARRPENSADKFVAISGDPLCRHIR